jgi:hypothetical protein
VSTAVTASAATDDYVMPTLVATAMAVDDSSLPLIAEVRYATERLVMVLGRRQQIEQRSAKQAARGHR